MPQRYGVSLSVRLPATELCSESRTLARKTPPAVIVQYNISVYFSHAHESRFYRRCLRMSLLRMQKNTNRIVDAEQNTSPHFEGDDAFVAEKLQSVRTGALPALILDFCPKIQ